MKIMPSRVKYRKMQKGRSKGIESRGTSIIFGSFALKSLGSKWISGKQLESCRKVILRYLKKGGKFWVRIFPDKPITNKGIEVSMGKGKGDVQYYAFPVRPGRIIFEIEGITEEMAKKALQEVASKLPIKTKFIKK